MMADLGASIDKACTLLASVKRLLVITGAGISADSGMPTYRGIGGLYDRGDTEDEVPIEMALSGPMFLSRPDLTWKYLLQMEAACREAQPNAGHLALSKMASSFDVMTVLTQNVDGFHRQVEQKNLIEIHGNMHDIFCTECAKQWRVKDYSELGVPPRCEDCRGMLRPRVVLFRELLPDEAVQRFEEALTTGVDAVMSIGTSSGFPYISGPVIRAARLGLPTIEINPGVSEVSSEVMLRIVARAVDVLPQMQARLQRQ